MKNFNYVNNFNPFFITKEKVDKLVTLYITILKNPLIHD